MINSKFLDVMAGNELKYYIFACSNRKKRFNRRNSTEFYATTFTEKLMNHCEQQLILGTKKCVRAFNTSLEKCMTQAPPLVNEMVCWPLRIDYICGFENVFSNAGAKVCDPSNVIDANFGKDYARMKELGRQLTAQSGNISLNYTKPNLSDLKAVKMINETSRDIRARLDEKAHYVQVLMRLVDRFMLLIYLKVIYGKYRYRNSVTKLN